MIRIMGRGVLAGFAPAPLIGPLIGIALTSTGPMAAASGTLLFVVAITPAEKTRHGTTQAAG